MDTKNYDRATAYFRRMEFSYPGDKDWGEFADAMDEVISTYVPVVRCKDCKHGTRCTNGAKLPAIQCFNSDNGEFGYCHEPDWFCADGEAKHEG